jgi:hypothetical protein
MPSSRPGVIFSRATDLIAEVERALTRLALAHDDLLIAVQFEDADKLETWGDARLNGVRESIETVNQRKHSTVAELDAAFERYKVAAGRLMEDAQAGEKDKVALSREALKIEFIATRNAGKRVVSAARHGEYVAEGLKWVVGVATSIGLAVAGTEYSARGREAERQAELKARIDEAALSKPLLDGGECTDEDWLHRGTVQRQPGVVCHVFTEVADATSASCLFVFARDGWTRRGDSALSFSVRLGLRHHCTPGCATCRKAGS